MTQRGVTGTHYKDSPKSRVTALRLTEEELETLKRAAGRSKITVPQYMRAEALKAAQKSDERAAKRAAKKQAEQG